MNAFKIIFLLLAITPFFAVQAQEEPATHMPAWELYKQDGTLVKSEDFAGKPLVLSFWGTWCPYCKKLHPGLDKLAKEYEAKGLQVLTVSIGEEPGAKPQTVLDKRGLTLQTVINGDKLAQEEFAVPGTPATVFIGPDGAILGRTMSSDPDDPQWKQAADYMVSLVAATE